MKTLSHRGYWKTIDEKNSWNAFRRTVAEGFGTETDVRDHLGTLTVSHDPPSTNSVDFQSLIEFFAASEAKNLPLAVNVKADGLAKLIASAFERANLEWFVFDMSFPDMREHLKVGNPVFARRSEFENPLDDVIGGVRGVWLDAFTHDWFDASTVARLLDRGLDVCVVSPELHGRDHRRVWEMLVPLSSASRLMICTDLPEEARAFGLAA